MEFKTDHIFRRDHLPYVTIDESVELAEQVVSIQRVAKVVKGGRRFSFSALVILGDRVQYVGVGLGKAPEVPDAIRKATAFARRRMIKVPKIGSTIPHEISAKFGAAHVMMRPASAGTGVIAGGAMRPILELAGVHDILAKSLRSNNPHNVTKATMAALMGLRRAEEVFSLRGVSHEMLDAIYHAE